MSKLTPGQRALLVARYADGEKREALAMEFGISRGYVTNAARRGGVPPRTDGRGRPRKVKK